MRYAAGLLGVVTVDRRRHQQNYQQYDYAPDQLSSDLAFERIRVRLVEGGDVPADAFVVLTPHGIYPVRRLTCRLRFRPKQRLFGGCSGATEFSNSEFANGPASGIENVAGSLLAIDSAREEGRANHRCDYGHG